MHKAWGWREKVALYFVILYFGLTVWDMNPNGANATKMAVFFAALMVMRNGRP